MVKKKYAEGLISSLALNKIVPFISELFSLQTIIITRVLNLKKNACSMCVSSDLGILVQIDCYYRYLVSSTQGEERKSIDSGMEIESVLALA